MSSLGADHYEWLRKELRKDPKFATGYLNVAAEEEALVTLMRALDNIAEAYREEYPDVAKKATQLRARLNDMRWPSLATGYLEGQALRKQEIAKKSAATGLRH